MFQGIDEPHLVLETLPFFNIQTSIKDPSVFTPPDYCPQNTEAKKIPSKVKGKFLKRFLWRRAFEGSRGFDGH